MRANGWVSRTFRWGLWFSFYLLPSIELTWIPRNRSFHIEGKWLVFEGKVNTFWKREP